MSVEQAVLEVGIFTIGFAASAEIADVPRSVHANSNIGIVQSQVKRQLAKLAYLIAETSSSSSTSKSSS